MQGWAGSNLATPFLLMCQAKEAIYLRYLWSVKLKEFFTLRPRDMHTQLDSDMNMDWITLGHTSSCGHDISTYCWQHQEYICIYLLIYMFIYLFIIHLFIYLVFIYLVFIYLQSCCNASLIISNIPPTHPLQLSLSVLLVASIHYHTFYNFIGLILHLQNTTVLMISCDQL